MDGTIDEAKNYADLFHYTGPDALHQIIANGNLYATDCRFLNDSKEVSYAIEDVAIPILHALEKAFPPGPDGYPGYGDLAKTVVGMTNPTGSNWSWSESATNTHFVTSLSREPDQLSQWRGYGGGTRGYVIGFSEEKIAGAAKYARGAGPLRVAELKEVVYEKWAQEALFQDLFSTKRNPRTPSSWVAARSQILGLAIRCKHPKFEEEREVRLIVDGYVGPARGPAINPSFRSNGRQVIPYLELDLKDEEGRIPLAVVVCGPNENPGLAETGVRSLLARYGYPQVPVLRSEVPYRE